MEQGESEIINTLEEFLKLARSEHEYFYQLEMEKEKSLRALKQLDSTNLQLLEERDKILELQAENERLKIQELKDRSTISKLLNLVQNCSCMKNTTSYIGRESDMQEILIVNKHDLKVEQDQIDDQKDKISINSDNAQVYELKIQTLQNRIKELNQVHDDKMQSVDAIMENQKQRMIEMEQDTKKLTNKLVEKLKLYQKKIENQTSLFFNRQKSFSKIETEMMTKILDLRSQLKCTIAKRDLKFVRTRGTNATLPTEEPPINQIFEKKDPEPRVDAKEFENLQFELKEVQKLSDSYRNQLIQLETKLASADDEKFGLEAKLNECFKRYGERLKNEKDKCASLEKRIRSEREGFRSEIRILRNKIKKLEDRLLMANEHTLRVKSGTKYTSDSENDSVDMIVLRQLDAMSSKSKKVIGQLKDLKLKITRLERKAIIK
ncbi:MAG: Coiled-coil domain-containing protein 77 [Paramarteilia canceri]